MQHASVVSIPSPETLTYPAFTHDWGSGFSLAPKYCIRWDRGEGDDEGLRGFEVESLILGEDASSPDVFGRRDRSRSRDS